MLHSSNIQRGITTYCLKSNFFINLTGEGMMFFSKIPALSSSSLLAMNYRVRNTNPELLIEVVMFRKLAAEFFGTFWLVFGGCGSAVLAAAFPELGIGFAGVALAFGLTVLTMAFAVGHISGGHFNPAVTFGLWAGGRFPAKDVIGYVIAQVVGGIVAAAALYLIASGKAGFDATASGFASNGFGEHSPGGYSMLSAVVIEIILTAGFLLVIHGATDKHAPAGFAPIAIGLALTLIHLISIPVTNTSVNPARSTAVAIFQGGWALQQLWFFWVMPIIGGVLGGLIYRTLLEKRD
jgi:aquaporin Z